MTPPDPAALTLGVEEEFLLLDPRDGGNLPVAAEVTAALPAGVRAQSRVEFRRSMLELVTPVCTGLAGLRAELTRLRRAGRDAARTAGAWLVAVGATPVAEPDLGAPPGARFDTIRQRYGPVAHDPAVCGMHVHVGVPDRELAVQVVNHLRARLPVVQALTANSPLYRGADTGHASWRSMQLLRWPGMGPAPHFASAAEHDAAVAALLESGMLVDDGMIFWYARLSARYPTIEVRVGDVCATADDAVLAAALIRAAVATAIADVRAGVPAHRPPSYLLAAAHWRAAHDGLGDALLDLRLGKPRPAWELVDEFVDAVRPALAAAGDLDDVRAGLDRLRRDGDGAARQRAALRRTGDVRAMLAERARTTAD
ncbi:carboxylate-amine ligase [Spirilliplanes yamanashiensis]|nr:glutamate--cysteine ligase [Spirilliplanes yamanashiensis]MDP9817463.1 carboxylate-amine ligase [Spirilliplanes yamanashiensis]